MRRIDVVFTTNLTPHKRLQGVLDNQSDRVDNNWLPNSGYTDIVLDDRVEEYWGAYVGQACKPLLRFKDHIKGAMSLIPQTLHYFTLWKGHGYRSMNFLRLWTLPNPDSELYNEEQTQVFANILEMVFARSFQSLPLQSLKKFFPDLTEPYAGLGLNVLSPLYQGFAADQSVRYAFTLRIGLSHDSEIREWPQFRMETKAPKNPVRSFKWGDLQRTKWITYRSSWINSMNKLVVLCECKYLSLPLIQKQAIPLTYRTGVRCLLGILGMMSSSQLAVLMPEWV